MTKQHSQKTITIAVLAILGVILVVSWNQSRDTDQETPIEEQSPEISADRTPEPLPPIASDDASLDTTTLIVSDVESRPGDDSTNPVIIQGKKQISNLKFSEARTTFSQLANSNSIARYYAGLLAAYYGDRENAKIYLQATFDRGEEPMAATAKRFLDTYALYDTYRDGPSEFLDTLLSREFLTAGEMEIAVDKLRFVTENHPDYSDAWILLGSAYLVRGNHEEALASLKQSLPSNKPESYYWLGIAYLYDDNPQKALAAFKESERKGYPSLYKVHEKMGDTYTILRQYRSAAKAYEAALAIESGYPELYVRPVWIYIDFLRNPESALELAKRSQTLFPDSALAHSLVAWSHIALEDYPKAKAALDLAFAIDEDLPAAHLNLGRYYEATGNTDEALKSYQKAVDLDPAGTVGEQAQDAFRSLVESLKVKE